MLSKFPVEQRFALFILAFFTSVAAWAAQPISGFVHRFGGEVFITLDSNTGALYRLQSSRQETVATLRRLTNGDFIMATAKTDRTNVTVDIDTIDFVGLRKIIGYWNMPRRSQVMNFRSYSDLNIYDIIVQFQDGGLRPLRKELKYTVIPGQGSEWVMFISDDQETQMAYLNLTESEAVLRLVNSRTGDVTSTLQLRKLTE